MRVMALFPLLLATACGNATQPTNNGTANQATVYQVIDPAMPEGVSILDGSRMPVLLRQCSRTTPNAGEGTWQPNVADIIGLEAALPAALAGTAHAAELARAPQGWERQYGGIVRGGRRFIYGNFAPAGTGPDHASPDMVQAVCDGGPVYFGVEYDVDARRFSHLAFNGAV